MKEEMKQNLQSLWLIARILVGSLFGVLLVAATLAYTVTVVSAADNAGLPMFVRMSLLLTALTSGLAGASWFKSLYVRWCLPELLDEFTKKLMDG